MTKSGVVSLLVVALAPCDTGLCADPPHELREGARIRLQAAGTVSDGTLAAQDAASLTLRVEDLHDPLVVPRATLERVYVSEGRARGKAAMIGAAIGLTVAGALVVAGSAGCDGGECLCSGSGCVAAVAILGIPAAATGAGIGALVAPERWREVPIPARAGSTRVGWALAPIHGGAAVSFSCRF
jgi:hypothetical protein